MRGTPREAQTIFILVHEKFSTASDSDRGETIFHFKGNHSQLERQIVGRVFSKVAFSITFSNTRAQDDQTLEFSFQPHKTSLTGIQEEIWNEKSIFEFGKLNEFTIDFSNNSIVMNNEKLSRSIDIQGTFEKLIFVGFYSEELTTWIVEQSNDL